MLILLEVIDEVVCVYLRGRERWRGRTASTPQPPRSWYRSAGPWVLAFHWADTSPPLRNTQSHITMTTTWTHTHTHNIHLCSGLPRGVRHATLRGDQMCQTQTIHITTHTDTAGAYRCSLSCSSGASVPVDTRTRSCPGCLCSHAHSSHC